MTGWTRWINGPTPAALLAAVCLGASAAEAPMLQGWTLLGSAGLRETGSAHGFDATKAGEGATRVAFLPIDSDARCGRATVSFANGERLLLDISDDDLLTKGELRVLHVPGNHRALREVGVLCGAANGGTVMIQVYADGSARTRRD